MNESSATPNLKLPATEVVKLAEAAGDTATALGSILADGKVNVLDVARLPALATAAAKFGDVDYRQALPQAVDLSADELPVVAAAFKTHLRLPDGPTEQVIEQGVDVLVAIINGIRVVIDLVRRPAAA